MSVEKVAVSACLLGENCKYNGGNNRDEKVIKYLEGKEYITVCPECYGGLSTPRVPSEIEEGYDGADVVKGCIFSDGEKEGAHVYSREGVDVTSEFLKGAQKALEEIRNFGAKKAILKESSPSCGVHKIYTGRFDGTKKEGSGVSAALFRNFGIELISEKDL